MIQNDFSIIIIITITTIGLNNNNMIFIVFTGRGALNIGFFFSF